MRRPPSTRDSRSCRWGSMPELAPADLVAAAREVMGSRARRRRAHGYRNAQTTLLAPTGTIGLLMDCDTTGVEPDFALVKFKKLAGGGYFKIANQSIEPALKTSATRTRSAATILTYVLGTLSLDGAPAHQPRVPRWPRASRDDDLDKIETPPAGRLRAAASPSMPGRSARRRSPASVSTMDEASQAGIRPAARTRLHPRRDRGSQRAHLRHDDRRGRAASEGRASARSSTPPTSAARRAPASSITWATSR